MAKFPHAYATSKQSFSQFSKPYFSGTEDSLATYPKTKCVKPVILPVIVFRLLFNERATLLIAQSVAPNKAAEQIHRFFIFSEVSAATS